jgi:hypothetical protein
MGALAVTTPGQSTPMLLVWTWTPHGPAGAAGRGRGAERRDPPGRPGGGAAPADPGPGLCALDAHRIRIRLLLPAGLDRGAPRRRNLELVQRVREIAGEKGVTPARLALAWVLSRGEDVVPIPGTKHVRLLEENLGAVDVQLEPGDLTRIEEAFPKGAAAGDRYADMSPINR